MKRRRKLGYQTVRHIGRFRRKCCGPDAFTWPLAVANASGHIVFGFDRWECRCGQIPGVHTTFIRKKCHYKVDAKCGCFSSTTCCPRTRWQRLYSRKLLCMPKQQATFGIESKSEVLYDLEVILSDCFQTFYENHVGQTCNNNSHQFRCLYLYCRVFSTTNRAQTMKGFIGLMMGTHFGWQTKLALFLHVKMGTHFGRQTKTWLYAMNHILIMFELEDII